MLFLGGVATGLLIAAGITVASFVLWRKVLKKKLDEVMLKASLKALEREKKK